MSQNQASPPISVPIHSKLASIALPNLSPTMGLTLVFIISLFVLAMGFLAGASWETGSGGIYFFGGLVAAGLAVGVAWLTISSVIDTLAALILMPYGIRDAARARALVMRTLTSVRRPRVYVREGEISPDSDPSLLEATRRGWGLLDLDPTSVVLIDRRGAQELLTYGLHELHYRDRILGAVSLRQQREVMEFNRVLTRDAMVVSVRVIVIYQIQQDMRHLQRHGSHLTLLETVRRAVMPRSEWKERTKRAVSMKIQELVGQYQLWEIFVAPTQPQMLDTGSLVTGLSFGKPPPSVRGELRTRLMESLQPIVAQWGVEIVTVSLDELAPPKEISEKAHIAYETWLERTNEIEKAERQAEAERRIALTQREQAELQKQTEIIHAETKASAEQHAAEIERATARIRSEMEAERKCQEAEAEKQAAILRAQAEAEAHRIRMLAKTEAGVELARRLELLQQGTGRSMDDRTMREFLRAIGFLELRDGRYYGDSRWHLRELLENSREEQEYGRRFETDDEQDE